MAGLRIGIDVGGTFTHGVVLRPPGEVLVTARTPTTHAHEHGVADGVGDVLRELLAQVDPQAVELVAHSTTQATNALLEGDVEQVIRAVIVPPGENMLCRMALRGDALDIGNGHTITTTTSFIPWADAEDVDIAGNQQIEESADHAPVAVIQPLAGNAGLREHAVALKYRDNDHPTVCASDITQVLGLTARSRTATVNASMLPTMLATAEYTERAVAELLPGVPLMVVRSDGGAMSIDEMRRQPILSLLSGPAAGASAALDRSGLSEVVFIEVGGTSTDITMITGGRVRHRHATVGGQRLMVPALDLRTVAVGGGSMLRTDGSRFGARSAHVAGLPYLFQALAAERQISAITPWTDPQHGEEYMTAKMGDGSIAAITLTDMFIADISQDDASHQAVSDKLLTDLNIASNHSIISQLQDAMEQCNASGLGDVIETARQRTCDTVAKAITELAASHNADLQHCILIAGGGGGPVLMEDIAANLRLRSQVIPHHTVISAIGAATAVTCASQSKTIAKPSGQDIAQLTEQVEERLRAQGAERMDTQYEYDAHRQVLTVTGRGSRAYEQDARVVDDDALLSIARELIGETAQLEWQSTDNSLWLTSGKPRLGCVLDRYGRSLWLGTARECFPVPGGEMQGVLDTVIDSRTAYTDGGPALPGLALVCDGRFIPLDQLGSRELITEVLRWENLPTDATGCFLIRS